MDSMRPSKKRLILYVGICVTIVSAVLVGFWNKIFNTILAHELALSSTSKSFELWKEPPIPIYLSVYLFNWTNAEEVVRSKWSLKPEFEECGPFVFSEHHIRTNVMWNENGTVTYRQKRIWTFVPGRTNGSLFDNITNVNPIVAVVGNKLKNIPIFKSIVDTLLRYLNEKLYVTKTVGQLLFDGYEDPVITEIIKLGIPGIDIPFDRVGWFYSRNNSDTYEGTFTIFTGKNDISTLGLMNLWNGLRSTSAYEGTCSLVNGSSGEIYAPVADKGSIALFLTDICSTLTLESNGHEEVLGVQGEKFVGTDYNFDNGSKYPQQSCFRSDGLVPSGARGISECKFDAPAFISYPHFYLADSSYLKAVKGLHPNKTNHETYLTLEPNTGIPLHANAKLQLNLFLEPIAGMSIFKKIAPTYMPVLWFHESAALTEEYCDLIKVLLVLHTGGFYTGCVLIGVGILLVLVGVYLLYYLKLTNAYVRLLNNHENLN